MKKQFVLRQQFVVTAFITAGIFFSAACGNETERSSIDADTVQAEDTTSIRQSSSHDSATGHGRLMSSMDKMMGSMHSMQMTGDFDVDFANMMIEHHQGGIDMAQIEMSHGKDEKMKAKAQEIITRQKEEQEKLREFVKGYKLSDMKHGEGELHKSMTGMESKMKAMQTNADVDKDFATMMISHHEHGIEMAKMQLKHGMSAELKKMAQAMVSHEQKEMKELQTLLNNSNK